MNVERRLITLLLVLGLVAVPAAALRAFCVGNSCDAAEERSTPVPFCSLDPAVRDLVTTGFYEGRSPDVLGVTGDTPVTTGLRGLEVPWPSAHDPTDDRVPLVFLGPGASGDLPDVTLDRVAPTLERILGLERPFPDVRSGRAIAGVGGQDAVAPLVVVIVWKGIGMPELEADPAAWPFLARALARGREGVARAGSRPLDPAAVLTTIGTGGLPSQHGIVGSTLRGDDGPVEAFGPGAPGTVIATLGDDLDAATGGGARIGLVAADPSDRGLIGGTWYGGRDDDLVVIDRRNPADRVDDLLAEGWGRGGPPDLLGLTVRGSVTQMDIETRAVVERVEAAVHGAVVAITATGSLAANGVPIDAGVVAAGVDTTLAATEPVIEEQGSGGLFLDDAASRDQRVTTQQVADAMAAQVSGDLTTPLFVDTFPSFTVRFGRYC